MTGTYARPSPAAQTFSTKDEPSRGDLLFRSWLRRMHHRSAASSAAASAAIGRQRIRDAFVERFAEIYLLRSSAHAHVRQPALGAGAAAGGHSGGDGAIERVRSSVSAVALMRRSLELAYREPTSGSAEAMPLRDDVLAALEAETWGAFLMAFLLVELASRQESSEIDEQQRALLRLAMPLTALATGRQAMAAVCEASSGFPGTGRPDDTDRFRLLRDALELRDREGGSGVLALDALLQLDMHVGLAALMGRVSTCLRGLVEPRLVAAGRQSVGALERAALWLESGKDRKVLEAGAGRLASTLARSLQLALLCEHAQWMLDREGDRQGFAAALRYSRVPVDLVHEVDPELDRALLGSSGITRGRG